MDGPRRTAVACAVTGVPWFMAAPALLRFDLPLLLVCPSYGLVAAAVLIRGRFRLWSVLLTWVIAVAIATWVVTDVGPAPPAGAWTLAWGGTWVGSLIALPWLGATATVRFLLLGADGRARFMSDVHG